MIFPLIGNEKIKSAVESALKTNRLPHAIIIEGETGLGRHTLASFISAAALCTGENPPCGECQMCRLAKSGNHPDITVVAPEDKKKNISVGQIRSLRQEAFVKPHAGSKRVFIIDKAETMNDQAQNALLKILEEPPGGVIFLLITESAAAMLETVLSRCILFTLSAPQKKAATEYIKANFKLKQDDSAIIKALEESKGNIGKAVTLLKKKNAGTAEALAKDFISKIFDGSEFELLSMLAPLEKDRVGADAFLSAFKYEAAVCLRNSYSNTQKAKVLTEIYNRTDDFSRALKTNINLALLFSAMVSTIKKLCKDY
ncbi:MAG: DNA polymerase III subunit delta' [Clostridia bacterium]|nr:DNA polymerase III subunit delta' [Clostridia bacterium]